MTVRPRNMGSGQSYFTWGSECPDTDSFPTVKNMLKGFGGWGVALYVLTSLSTLIVVIQVSSLPWK